MHFIIIIYCMGSSVVSSMGIWLIVWSFTSTNFSIWDLAKKDLIMVMDIEYNKIKEKKEEKEKSIRNQAKLSFIRTWKWITISE